MKDFYSDRVDNSAPPQPGQVTKPSGQVRIVLDSEEKLLLIQSTPEDYADILATLRALDRPRQQVYLSSMIAEVGMTGSLKFGVEYFLQALNKDGIGLLELSGTPGLPDIASAGAFFVGGDGLAIVQALESQAEVNILSQPKLTVSDGAEGSIQVGGSVPVVKAKV
jgi:general secretion pathway protein D